MLAHPALSINRVLVAACGVPERPCALHPLRPRPPPRAVLRSKLPRRHAHYPSHRRLMCFWSKSTAGIALELHRIASYSVISMRSRAVVRTPGWPCPSPRLGRHRQDTIAAEQRYGAGLSYRPLSIEMIVGTPVISTRGHKRKGIRKT